MSIETFTFLKLDDFIQECSTRQIRSVYLSISSSLQSKGRLFLLTAYDICLNQLIRFEKLIAHKVGKNIFDEVSVNLTTRLQICGFNVILGILTIEKIEKALNFDGFEVEDKNIAQANKPDEVHETFTSINNLLNQNSNNYFFDSEYFNASPYSTLLRTSNIITAPR